MPGSPSRAAPAGNAAGPVCDLCGAGLAGTSHLVSELGSRFCLRHRDLPGCRLCGAPVGGSGGRLCAGCGATAIHDQQGVRQRIPAIRRDLNRMGIRLELPVRVRLVSPAEMATLGRSLGPHLLGLTVGIGRQVVDLAILSGLSATEFGAVVAHECMHAWLIQHGSPRPRDLQLEEGLCELAAYGWLGRQSDPRAAVLRKAISTNPDPLYGEGFRRLRTLAREHGVRAILTSIGADGVLPASRGGTGGTP